MGWDTSIDEPNNDNTANTTTNNNTVTNKVGDSTEITHTKPLYEVVADHIQNWKAIGASTVIQEWIT